MSDLLGYLAANLTPIGGPCTAARFFEPTTRFLDMMSWYMGRTIYDVGCGQGQVTVALRDAGHKVIPIDIRGDGALVDDVVESNAVTFPFEAGSVVLFARPCHGVFFVEPTIENAVGHGVSTIVYVGFTKNIREDTGRYRKLFRYYGPTGSKEKESIYEAQVK